VEKCGTRISATFEIKKKTAQRKNLPMGENSPNLVTLAQMQLIGGARTGKKLACRFFTSAD
jgi:hypothetical protein